MAYFSMRHNLPYSFYVLVSESVGCFGVVFVQLRVYQSLSWMR